MRIYKRDERYMLLIKSQTTASALPHHQKPDTRNNHPAFIKRTPLAGRQYLHVRVVSERQFQDAVVQLHTVVRCYGLLCCCALPEGHLARAGRAVPALRSRQAHINKSTACFCKCMNSIKAHKQHANMHAWMYESTQAARETCTEINDQRTKNNSRAVVIDRCRNHIATGHEEFLQCEKDQC